MEPPAAPESSTLVVRLVQDASGACRIEVEGAGERHEYALVPFTLSIQVWMPAEAPLLRAILRLHGTRQTAVMQSSRQLIELLQAWLTAEPLRASETNTE